MNRTFAATSQRSAEHAGGGASAAGRAVGGRALGALVGLLLVLGGGGAFLFRFAGVPRLPQSLPDWGSVWFTLQGADVPVEAALYVSGTVAWGLWLWLSASVVLRLVVLATDGYAHGTAWAVALRALSDRVTLPVIRRVVDGAVVATIVVQFVGRVSTVSAAPLASHETAPTVVAPVETYQATPSEVVTGAATTVVAETGATTYQVKRGDNLWDIARQFYGQGDAFPRIVEANEGRTMADGRTFTRSGVIQPGWELRIPLPDLTVATASEVTYVVQPGDSLSSIAGRLLTGPDAWPTIFAANRGTASLPDGRVLTRPDLIWPGLRLSVPAPAAPPPAGTAAAPGQSVSLAGAPVPTALTALAVAAAQDVSAPPQGQDLQPMGAAPEVVVAPEAAAETASALDSLDSSGAGASAPVEGAPATLEHSAVESSAVRSPAIEGPQEDSNLRDVPAPRPASGAQEMPANQAEVAPGEAFSSLESVPGPDATPAAEASTPAETAVASAAPQPVAAPAATPSPWPLDDPATPSAAGGQRSAPAATGTAGAAGAGDDAPAPARAPRGTGERGPGVAPRDGRAGLAAAGAATVAAAAGVAMLRKRARRGLGQRPATVPDSPPAAYSEAARAATDITLDGGFAEAEITRALVHRLHGGDADPATAAAGQIRRYLSEHGLADVTVLTLLHGRETTGLSLEVTLRATMAEQAAIISLAPAIGARLGGTGRARPTSDGDVLLSLSEVRSIGLFEPVGPRLMAPAGGDTPPPGALLGGESPGTTLLPLGARSRRHVLYAPWDELQHVLIAGTLGGGAATVLASTVSAIAGRFRPDALRLWTIGSPRLLPPELLAFPHQIGAPVDPTDDARMEEVVHTVRTELVRRMRRTEPGGATEGPLEGGSGPLTGASWPDIVLVVPELAHGRGAGTIDLAGDLGGNSGHGGHGALLELLHTVAVDGPAYGIRLLGATSHPEALDPEVIAIFPTRLVLQQPDAAPSVRLLGRPDAAVLQGGGHLLFSIDGRAPVELRGFRLSHERLVDLLRLLTARFGTTGPRPLDEPLASSPPFVHRDPAAGTAAEGHSTVVPAPKEPPSPATVTTLASPPLVSAGALPTAGAPTESAAPEAPEVGSESTEPDAPAGRDAAPRVEIHCFGGFEVFWNERRLSATGQAGPRHRSWEILAFLAAQPAEVVSTEKLLNAIWPDSDAEKAASALGAALSRLRGVLTDQVPGLTGPIVSRDRIGRTCHLDSVVISSDVHQFVRVCREARRLSPGQAIEAYQTARRLYAGDLLKDASYVWLHERDDDGLTLPERYRETYRLITNELAGLFVQGGQTGEAVSLYRELLRAEPTLEDVARRLYRCFGRLGDRVSLVREHHRLQQALQEVYSGPDALDDDPALTTPEPETITVFEEVLAALDARETTDAVTGEATGKELAAPGRGAKEDEEEGCAA